MQWDLQVFVASCCSSFTWGFQACLPVATGWAGLLAGPAPGHYGRGKAIQKCAIQRLTQGGLQETPAAGLCTNMQNLATELGNFWGRLCRALVPTMLRRSEDQLALPMEVPLASGACSEILGLSV